MIKDNGWPMVMNCVIHRLNIDHIDRIIEMAAELGAEYLELANTQYYGWAFLNRDQLMPTARTAASAPRPSPTLAREARQAMRLFFVVPDYHEGGPRSA
jgi:pyrroloquinoline quinone biosynthesis protein E